MKATLVLENGLVFEGKAFGCIKEASGEVVFNTAMTGYQEVLTDPSYRGQMVCMTYPLIGNYGINDEDMESKKVFLNGFIIKERSRIVSNWRSTKDLDTYLKEQGVVGIEGIDTRSLTLHLRIHGAQKGIIATGDHNISDLVDKAKNSRGVVGVDLVQEVAEKNEYAWSSEGKFHVIALDSGIKFNILRCLTELGCRVTVLPPTSSADEILKHHPDGLFLSNGPGDPEVVDYVVSTVKQLITELPIFGICLGHQILARALGGKTFKLKFGHHGANHPVKDLDSGTIEITSQNHGFAVDIESITQHRVRLTHMNLNDGTCEGFEHCDYPVFSVQYHPEAAPGPHDSHYLFKKFIQKMTLFEKIPS